MPLPSKPILTNAIEEYLKSYLTATGEATIRLYIDAVNDTDHW